MSADGFDGGTGRDGQDADRAREQRRREREARRRAREAEEGDERSRRSLADRVGRSGAASGAADRPQPASGEPAPVDTEIQGPEDRSPAPAASSVPRSGLSVRWRRRLFAIGGLGLALLAGLGLLTQLGSGEEQELPPPPKLEVTSVLVPEGLTRSQVADLASEAKLRGDYVKQTKSFRGFDPARYGAEDAPHLEGFLFPATYEVARRAKVEDLISRQLEAFEREFDSVGLGQARAKNLTPYEVLIIASMIEKEVQVSEERPLVSAVIQNRLAAGMPLGIDATIRFALDKYEGQLTESELAIDSPYNTRTNAGLPPTPIANPGRASIEAAAKPAKVDFLYFVIEPGTCNEHVFTASEQEFLEAQAVYQAALAEQGGSPTECP